MPTTPNNYEPSEIRLNLWLTHPEVFAYLDRVGSTPGYRPEDDLLAYVNFQNDWRITPAMIAEAEEWMEGWQPPNEPAYPFDVRDIPNGNYSLDVLDAYDDDVEETYHYQIYTVTSGRWAGRRVIKYREDGSSAFKAYAFLNADGTWTLWSRFRARAGESFVSYTPTLLTAIMEQYQSFRGRVQDSDEWRITSLLGPTCNLRLRSMHCRICNNAVDSETGFLRQLCYSHVPQENRGLMDSLRAIGVPVEGREPGTAQRRVPLAMCEITNAVVQ